MSCSVQLKTRSSVKSKKVNNVIHRTTSETIRLGEPEVIISNSSRQVMTALAISPPPLKKSTCSFQITGVSLTQRPDFGGDDSADDLDESHTDDISRVTDNETPSFSEDTCSRDADDNYIGSCSALCSVTVIPTSSQYGLAAIVPSETSTVLTGNASECSVNSLTSKASTSAMSDITETQSSSSKEVPVTTATCCPTTSTTSEATPSKVPVTTTVIQTEITTTQRAPVTRTSRFPGTRFEIVKVETTRPFRRGRWHCMDYLDDSVYTPKNALTYKSPDSPEISGTRPQPQYTMTATTTQVQTTCGNTNFGTKYVNPLTTQGVIQQNVHSMAAQQSQAYTAQEQYSSDIVRQSQTYSTPISIPTQQTQSYAIRDQHNQITGTSDFMQTHSLVRQSSVPETQRAHASSYVIQNPVQYVPMGNIVGQNQNYPLQQLGPTSVVPQFQQAESSRSLHHSIGVPATVNLSYQQGQLMSREIYGVQNPQVFYPTAALNQPAYVSQASVYVSPPQIPSSVQSYSSNLVESRQNQNVIYSKQPSGISPQIIQNQAPPQVQANFMMQGQSNSTPTPIAPQYSIPQTSWTNEAGDFTQVGRGGDSSDSHSSGKTSHSSTRKSSLEPLVEDVSLVTATVQDLRTSVVTTSVPMSSGAISKSSPSGSGNVPAMPSTSANTSTGDASSSTSMLSTASAAVAMPSTSDPYFAEIQLFYGGKRCSIFLSFFLFLIEVNIFTFF